ncbi:MAG: nitroreductase family protein [Planctomycetes bacterium]|nr:nitroreductase family protein [Planctomycetota bacterium]
MNADGKGAGNDSGALSRRRFCKGAALGLGGLALSGYWGSRRARAEEPGPLLPPIVTGNSTEICLNSRVSRHSGLGGTATDQKISNVLWAAGKAPVTGSYQTIYLKTPNATYIYHPEDHSLEYYSAGTVSNAFRINYDRERDFDAGVSYVLALWASVSLWTGTSSQVASCPQMSDLNFGINTVPGLTSQLVAVSSDGSLPNPATDGQNNLEEVLADLRLRDRLRTDLDLTPQRLSQILWAGYGCSAHWTSNGRGGLTVPSWVANYFLTNRIYVVDARVSRYCNRVGTNLATRDHRLELVQDADVRNAVRQALPDLPEAPCYVLLCLTQTGLDTWYQRLETGFVAGGILLQAGASGLGCAFKAALSSAEQAALQQITQIPAGDYPHAVVAVGHRPADLDGDGDVDVDDLDAFGTCMAGPDADAGPGCEPADLDMDGDVDLGDFTELQRG